MAYENKDETVERITAWDIVKAGFGLIILGLVLAIMYPIGLIAWILMFG